MEWFKLRDLKSVASRSSRHKISYKSTHRFKIYTHLRNLNVGHVGMVQGRGLNVYGVEITLSVIAYIQNFIQIQKSVQKLSPTQKSAILEWLKLRNWKVWRRGRRQ
jgi:hypothetical protein